VFIDKNVGLPQLLGTAKIFLEQLFSRKDLELRVRPGFFPFVVPGVEIDMRCVFCKNGCSICKRSTWIEVFPGGLIHPLVLQAGNIDTNKYSGFAFGFGVDRLAMLRHQINDVRLFKCGDARFSTRF
jgi:phenylalanyl-tRNA synthetase alpha chain